MCLSVKLVKLVKVQQRKESNPSSECVNFRNTYTENKLVGSVHSSQSGVMGSAIQPTPKKGFRMEKAGFPFPNFLLGDHEVPSICRCVFDGEKFYVLSSKDMHTLNHNGAFGVSSLTYRGPSEDNPSFYFKPYFAKKN